MMAYKKLKKRNLSFVFRGLIGLVILFSVCCSQFREHYENQRRELFNKNFEVFQKLEQMQREDINVFAISTTRHMSFKEAEGLKRAIAKGYTYKQNNIDRYKNVATHKFHYTFKNNDGLTNERWSEYKKLLQQANLVHFSYQYDRPDKRQVWFYGEDEIDSGYVYMTYPPPNFFNSFKECKPIMPSQSCYIVLRKDWYMFSEKFRLEQD